MPIAYLYEEDITGTNPANKVVDEIHLVTPATEPGSFSIICPKAGPYFRNSLIIEHIASGQVLTPGIDWQPSHVFDSASHETEWVHGGIYGSLIIMNRNLTGYFKIREFQTLGGEWLMSNDRILEVISNRLYDPRTATYEQIAGKPNAFPPLIHDQPIDDLTTFRDVIIQLGFMTEAIQERTDTWLENPPLLMGQYYLKTETAALIDAKIEQRVAPIESQLLQLTQTVTNGLADRYTKAQSDLRYVRT